MATSGLGYSKSAHKLSVQALILIDLMKKQPLTKSELLKKSTASRAQFYRAFKALEEHGIIAERGGFCIIKNGQYTDILCELEEVFRKYIAPRKNQKSVSLIDLASRVGRSPKEIEEKAYVLAKKYKTLIGSETSPPLGVPTLQETIFKE